MKFWKRWTAALLMAAMLLTLLTACGPSGSTAPDQPDKPGESESGGGTGKEKTEAEKAAETVNALNAVRKEKGLGELQLNAEACAMAEKMAQLQLDGVNGVYGSDVMKSDAYSAAWNVISKQPIDGKKVVGIGAYGGYPDETVFKGWLANTGKWKPALVTGSEATIVGVGVVKNTNPKTTKDYPYMVAVLTY